MRNHKLALFGVAALTLTLATGCAKPPQQEIDALKASLASAEQAEAPKYSPDAWSKAQADLNAVNAEVEAQANKFALFRSYTKTKELITAASSSSAEAQQAAAAGKEAARTAATDAVAAAKASVDSANAMIAELAACRRQPKDFKKDMEVMRGTLDGLAAQVAGLESQLAAEDFLGAQSAASSLQASVDALNADMAAAKEKIRC